MENTVFDQEQHGPKGLNLAIEKINEMAGNYSLVSSSLCEKSCLKIMRDIVVQLKLIQWGYHGPAEATAGMYIAYHRKKIGSYFTNSLNNQWPYTPLHNKPNDLEIDFNGYLM